MRSFRRHLILGCALLCGLPGMLYVWKRVSTQSGKIESEQRNALEASLKIKQWHFVESLAGDIAQFESVFWEPEDTLSLRSLIGQGEKWKDAQILEIGAGTGLVSLCCVQAGAAKVVATDINPAAVANSRYNAEILGYSDRIECRQVAESAPGPFIQVHPNEQFDFILSNPPWEDAEVREFAAYALYDPQFQLLDAILSQAAIHLRPQGELLLCYGGRTAIQRILDTAPKLGWKVEVLDDRKIESLPEVFVPAVTLRLTTVSDAPK